MSLRQDLLLTVFFFSLTITAYQPQKFREDYTEDSFRTKNLEKSPIKDLNHQSQDCQIKTGYDNEILELEENYLNDKKSVKKRSYQSESYAIPQPILDDLTKLSRIAGEVKNGIISLTAHSKTTENLNKLLNVLFSKVLEDPQKLVDTLSPDQLNPRTTLELETDVIAGYKNDLNKGTKINLNHKLFESEDKKSKLDLNLKSEVILFNDTNYKISNQSGIGLHFQSFF